MLIVTNKINSAEIVAAGKLIHACQEYDGSYRSPYLSNMLNFDPNMPAFFLYYEAQELVGLLTVYADDENAEVAVMVHPGYRRKGIARQLVKRFREEIKSYPIETVEFQTERVFLAKNPDFVANWELVENDETETWLGRARLSYKLDTRSDLQVRLADVSHQEVVAHIQVQAFDNSFEVSLKYAQEAIADESSLLYVLLKDGQVVASCTVDLSSDVNYLYGLAVADHVRKQGFGTYLVKSLINDLLESNEKPFQIAVEDANLGAKRLYEKIGFVKQTEVVYLKPKD